MILRRITVERYGCFGAAEFEFRRGMNLISGGNDSGKSLLLAALPAALFGVDQGARLRSWGDSLSCRVTLLFEGTDCGLRLARDLESNLVRLEESGADGSWRECFAGMVPATGATAARGDYFHHLERLLSVRSEPLLRVLLDAVHAEPFAADGRLADGLITPAAIECATAAVAESGGVAVRQQLEIDELEAELAVDRAEYHKGKEYLAWIRKRWGKEGGKVPTVAGSTASKPGPRDAAALERQREQLLVELKQQGLPVRLPADLPALFDEAEGLRQELASMQLELTPLQRRKQGVTMPGIVWPMLATLASFAALGGAYWLRAAWVLPLAAGCGALLLLMWSVFLVRFSRARAERNGLEQELQAVEQKRAEALARQSELAEKFEAYGLSSTPVEMVKLQQSYRRNEELVGRYRVVCAQLGGEESAIFGAGRESAVDRHLRPEDLPEAEARLAELGESLQRREVRLEALRNGTASITVVDSSSPVPQFSWSGKELFQIIGQQLERLTAGRFREIRLEEGRMRLEVGPGRWAAPASCSRGTTACLELAIRLALCQMTGGLLPLPVDDLLAHLDTRRRQAALRTLERYAVDHQLLLASCDEELVKRAARERWHVLNLNTVPTEQVPVEEEKTDAGQLHLL